MPPNSGKSSKSIWANKVAEIRKNVIFGVRTTLADLWKDDLQKSRRYFYQQIVWYTLCQNILLYATWIISRLTFRGCCKHPWDHKETSVKHIMNATWGVVSQGEKFKILGVMILHFGQLKWVGDPLADPGPQETHNYVHQYIYLVVVNTIKTKSPLSDKCLGFTDATPLVYYPHWSMSFVLFYYPLRINFLTPFCLLNPSSPTFTLAVPPSSTCIHKEQEIPFTYTVPPSLIFTIHFSHFY